jgi:hypothetical protein
MEQLGGTRQAELDAADMRRAVDQLALGLPLEGRAQRGAGWRPASRRSTPRLRLMRVNARPCCASRRQTR